MASSFPSSLDTFTNPSSTDALDSVSVPHATQHSDLNDAVEAIETALLDGAPLHIDDANERVGVGNVSPSYKLDVTGDINASGDVRVGGNSLPRGQIAIASSAADFLATTGGVDIIDTSVTLTSSRILKISYYAAITNPSTNLQISLDVRNGPVATATVQYQSATASLGTAADSNIISLSGIYSATFAAGTHDFYLIGTTSTGTAILNGSSAGRFHFLIVDDMGAG